jgi:hypothetical protein
MSDFEKGIRDRTKDALLEAMETGDWSEAFGGALEDAARQGLKNAVSQGIDLLFDLLSDGLASSGIADGLSSGISSFFSSFGGAKAGGGDVKRGTAYLVGEMGPEYFVPNVDGSIIANGAGAPSNASVVGPGGGGVSVRGGDLIIQGDASEKTVGLIRDELGNFAEQVPGMIRQEVTDGNKRGRF